VPARPGYRLAQIESITTGFDLAAGVAISV
jgi:hypothetical protein